MSARPESDHGVALVEFALVAPLLFLLVFGIIEFGWAFGQNLDVRQGAREGARLAIVNYATSTSTCTAGDTASCNNTRQSDLLSAICGRLDFDKAGTKIRLTRTDGTDSGTEDFNIGDTVVVEVEKPLDTLTGSLDVFLSGVVLNSRVEMRIEQPAQWTEMGSTSWHTCT